MSYRLKHNLDIRTTISVLQKLNEQLCLSVPRIAHKEEVMEKLLEYSKVRMECNCNELSVVLGISRQTIYNWMDRGYLILNKAKKICVFETYHYWFSKDVEKRLYKNKLRLMSRFLPNKI